MPVFPFFFSHGVSSITICFISSLFVLFVSPLFCHVLFSLLCSTYYPFTTLDTPITTGAFLSLCGFLSAGCFPADLVMKWPWFSPVTSLASPVSYTGLEFSILTELCFNPAIRIGHTLKKRKKKWTSADSENFYDVSLTSSFVTFTKNILKITLVSHGSSQRDMLLPFPYCSWSCVDILNAQDVSPLSITFVFGNS